MTASSSAAGEQHRHEQRRTTKLATSSAEMKRVSRAARRGGDRDLQKGDVEKCGQCRFIATEKDSVVPGAMAPAAAPAAIAAM